MRRYNDRENERGESRGEIVREKHSEESQKQIVPIVPRDF
jgi:hypothetical protein